MRKPFLSWKIITTKLQGTTSNSSKNIRVISNKSMKNQRRTKRKLLNSKYQTTKWNNPSKELGLKKINLNLSWDSLKSTKWAYKTIKVSLVHLEKKLSKWKNSLCSSQISMIRLSPIKNNWTTNSSPSREKWKSMQKCIMLFLPGKWKPKLNSFNKNRLNFISLCRTLLFLLTQLRKLRIK